MRVRFVRWVWPIVWFWGDLVESYVGLIVQIIFPKMVVLFGNFL
jgi:hypothetical protein